MNILILGGNGFIGSSLTECILETTDWHVYGMDMQCHKLGDMVDHERFHFFEGDITINHEWIEYHVKKCDVILPLVAIANPALYVQKPLTVFELDFEANLNVIRHCVKYNKRVIFPSTSEIYGMCNDENFDEETSNLVLGPINKQRWIYSCSKQLLDRVLFAYGVHENLDYTLFRPFNWVGAKLDNLTAEKEGSARVVTQFLSNILHHQEIHLVNGGKQRRCFTCIDDGVSALMSIIENKDGCATRGIFNVGNPDNDFSIREVAHMILELVKEFPAYAAFAEKTKIIDVAGEKHFGKHYQDIEFRVPSIVRAKDKLGWEPKIGLKESLHKAISYHLRHDPDELLS
ncbi:MAG: bifunctional UDP-4-keto-pentose/UDP-xylose synthase [bacterium]|nr:bifunctional UDP-4-keto-pentose/UDP-xylose synthase [bacterium]